MKIYFGFLILLFTSPAFGVLYFTEMTENQAQNGDYRLYGGMPKTDLLELNFGGSRYLVLFLK